MYTKISESLAIARRIAKETFDRVKLYRRKCGNKYTMLLGPDKVVTDLSPHQFIGILQLVESTAIVVKEEMEERIAELQAMVDELRTTKATATRNGFKMVARVEQELNKVHAELRQVTHQRDTAVEDRNRIYSDLQHTRKLALNMRKAAENYAVCKEALEYTDAHMKLAADANKLPTVSKL